MLVGIVYACMDEDGFWDMLNPQDKVAITEAKAWYESWKGTEAIELRSSSSLKGRRKVKPLWENAFMKQNKGYKTVEVLLAAEKGHGFVTQDCYAKYEETGDNRYLHSRTCLVVQTDKKTGQTEGFVMTLSPNLAYLEHSQFNPFRKNSYLERDAKFSGLVVYHDRNANFVNAWRYDEGIAYALTPVDENSGPELRDGGCTLYYELGIPGTYNPTTKELKFQDVYSIEEAFPEEFLHLYQDAYYNGIAQHAGYANIEFEAKVMLDVIYVNAFGCCANHGATQTNGDHYSNWIQKITNFGTRFPYYWNLLETDYQYGGKSYWHFLSDFRNDPIRYQYTLPVDTIFLPNALTNLASSIDISSDCN